MFTFLLNLRHTVLKSGWHWDSCSVYSDWNVLLTSIPYSGFTRQCKENTSFYIKTCFCCIENQVFFWWRVWTNAELCPSENFFFLYYSNNVTILEDKDSLYKNRHSNFPFITAFSSTWEGSYIFILLHLELWSFCAMCYFIDLCTFSFHVSFLPVWISYIRCWGFRLMNGFMCFLIFICSVYPLFCYPYGNYSGLYSSPWKTRLSPSVIFLSCMI